MLAADNLTGFRGFFVFIHARYEQLSFRSLNRFPLGEIKLGYQENGSGHTVRAQNNPRGAVVPVGTMSEHCPNLLMPNQLVTGIIPIRASS
jgi:hypothetical protein